MSVTTGLPASKHDPSDYSSNDPLYQALRKAARRIIGLRLLKRVSLVLCCSGLIGVLIVGLSKLNLYPTPSPLFCALLFALSLPIGAVLALYPRLNRLDVARLTEQRADLKERLSSAVEFHTLSPNLEQPFLTEQFQDANRHAARVDLRSLYPARWPRPLMFAIPAWLLLLLVYLLPTLPMFQSRQKRDEAVEVHQRGLQILKLTKDMEKHAQQQNLTETKRATEEARKLGEAMRKNRLTKKESLVALAKLTRKMQEQQRKMADGQPKKSLEEASKQLKKSMDQTQKELAQAQQKRAQQAQQAKSGQKPGQKQDQEQQKESEAMKQARAAMQQMQKAMAQQNPQQMQQAMQQMAQAMQKGGMSHQEMQQMAQMMQQMAQAMQNTQMNPSAQQMAQLAQMMQSSDGSNSQALSEMMRRIAQGMGDASKYALASMDAKMLGDLIAALQGGKMTMPGNGRPGNGGSNGGPGFHGHGHPSTAMKDPGSTQPKLQVGEGRHLDTGVGKSGSIAAFQKYLAQANAGGKHLPNGQIKGSRSHNGQELSMQMTGVPGPAQSLTPYYQAVETSRKQAESALSKESVPASMKKQVHDYFNNIQP